MTRMKTKLGLENLEDRKMMAADMGVDMAPTANANGADFAITANWQVRRLNLIVTGTEFNDNIQLNELDNNYIQLTAVTTNDLGEEIGSKSEVFHRNALVNIFAVLGDGDDRIDNSVANKTMVAYGGDGDDTLLSDGRANLFGQGGDDYIWGSNFDDYLVGGVGEDFIYGRNGDDSMKGGAQNDMLLGGGGNDTMIGDSGDDRMYGHSGNDIMHGANGEDLMKGGFGDDIMFGGNGDDAMEGNSGDDIMRGMNGEDRLDGGTGNDRLDGGNDDDLLLGGDGDDELIGRSGFDRLFGGRDNDILDGGDDGIADIQHGGSGADTFVRHKHVFNDDPDLFLDFNSDEGDEKDNDWAWSNYGNDFPEETDYFG